MWPKVCPMSWAFWWFPLEIEDQCPTSLFASSEEVELQFLVYITISIQSKFSGNIFNLQLASLSSPMVFGGLGRLRMTSLASCDLLTMASFKRTAVCMRRMLFVDSLILQQKLDFNQTAYQHLLNPKLHWLRQILTTLCKFHWWFWIFLDAITKAKILIFESIAQNLKRVSMTKSFLAFAMAFNLLLSNLTIAIAKAKNVNAFEQIYIFVNVHIFNK